MFKKRLPLILMIGLLFSLAFTRAINSSVGIGVNPPELLFSVSSDSAAQTQSLYIINTGSERARYEISVDAKFLRFVHIEPTAFELDPREVMEVKISILPWRFLSTETVEFNLYAKAMLEGGVFGPGIKVPVYVNFEISSTPVARALNYLRSVQQDDGSIGGFATSAWAVMAIASAGEDPHKWRSGDGPSIVDYLRDNAEMLNPNKPTDWERQALAIIAAGEDPRNFNGVNYIEVLKGFFDGNQIGDESLLNDDFWGLMTLVAAGEGGEIIDDVKAFIKANQNEDGGWSWGVGQPSDVDDTAAAIMALVAAGEPKSSRALQNAVNYLKGKLSEDGGFVYDSTPNSASDSWAIMALEALNVNLLESEWARNGINPIGHLLSLQNSDGSFSWATGQDGEVWWTAYAIPALLGKAYPIEGLGYTTSFTTTSTSETSEVTEGVYVRIEGPEYTIWEGKVEIPDNVTLYCHNSGKHYLIGGDNALAMLVRASEIGAFNYTCSDAWFPDMGFYVDSIGGYEAQGAYGWLYRVNYILPPESADRHVVKDGDEVLWYWGTQGVRPIKLSIDKNEVDPGEPFTVTALYLEDSTGEWLPLEGAEIKISPLEGTSSLAASSTQNSGGYVTGSDGKATITISSIGLYMIYAEKWGESPQDQFVRSNKVYVGVGVPIPEISSSTLAFLALVLITSYTLIKFRKDATDRKARY